MAFEDFLVTLRDDQLGKLRCQKPLQPPDPTEFIDLSGDTHLQVPVQSSDLLVALP
jgi:hypothetical protein